METLIIRKACEKNPKTHKAGNPDRFNVIKGAGKLTDLAEGITSLIAGTYVLSLAVTSRNMALRTALGVAGGYLILRSGSKLRAGSFSTSSL